MPFTPKQAKVLLDGPNGVATYESTGGKTTAKFIANNLSLIPPIQANSVILDNGCGSGTVTRALLNSSAPSGIKIHAIDKDQAFIDTLQEDVVKNNWPVEVKNMRMENLEFPDDFFTHSMTNIAIFFTTSAGLDGAKEIYRTLKPGGTAVVNCWNFITWFAPIMAVHNTTRPGKGFPAPPINWEDGTHMQKQLLAAGFEKEKMRMEWSEAWSSPEDLRHWAELTWAFLGGIGGWQESDEERWDEAVDMLVENLKLADGSVIGEDGNLKMKASQWVAIVTK